MARSAVLERKRRERHDANHFAFFVELNKTVFKKKSRKVEKEVFISLWN
jgi:hypothetical protein